MGFWSGLKNVVKRVATVVATVALGVVAVIVTPSAIKDIAAITIGAISEIISTDDIDQYLGDSFDSVIEGELAEHQTLLGQLGKMTLNVLVPDTGDMDYMRNLANILSKWQNTPERYTSLLVHGGELFANKVFRLDTAKIGAFFLMMDEDFDENGNGTGVYHANFNCWQQIGGYNDFYDWVFNLGTSADNAKFKFSDGERDYIIWAWKGDYVNLGAGAELGIYSNKSGILGQVDVTNPYSDLVS